jgi:hypothetical protein
MKAASVPSSLMVSENALEIPDAQDGEVNAELTSVSY